MFWQPPLTSPDGCLGNCTSTEEDQHVQCTLGEPQEMAQCSFPCSAEVLLHTKGVRELWEVLQPPKETWQGYAFSSSGEISSRSYYGNRRVRRAPEKGACVGNDPRSPVVPQFPSGKRRLEGCVQQSPVSRSLGDWHDPRPRIS